MMLLSDGMFPDYPCTYAPIPAMHAWREHMLSADIIQCIDYYTFGANVCRIGHPRVVCYLNENVPFNPQYMGHALANKHVLQGHAARLVAVSTSVQDALLVEGVDSRKVIVCPFWVTPAIYVPTFPPTDEETRRHVRRALHLSESQPVVLYVGRLSTVKGLSDLGRAVEGLPLTWVLVGARQDYTPPAWAEYREHVTSPEHLRDYYMAADVLVLPSVSTPTWIEQFGRVLVEAQACGCPVIATDLGGPRDIVRHNKTGFLVPPGSVASLRGAILRIVEDKGLRDQFRENARRWYLKAFETAKIEQRLQTIFADVMIEKSPETGREGTILEEVRGG